MKKLRYRVLAGLCACLVGIRLFGLDIKEGVDYVVLQNPITNAEDSVIEVYSYACPFCFKYAKILPQIIEKLPKGVDFRPYHLEQKGDYGKVANELFAVLITKDKQSGVGLVDKKSLFYRAENAYFEEYHINKNRWLDGKDPQGFLETGLKAAGITESEYHQALATSEVKKLLKDWEASYNIAIVQGIPAFVVNGKYLIKISELKSLDDLGEKIIELLSR